MDKLNRYRQVVEQVIREYASHKPSNGQIQSEAVIDREGDHYQVLNVGWDQVERVHDTIIHVDIVEGKIWIQCNNTDRLLADELVEAGVPKEDIVLAFHPAELWQHTGFGVAPPTASHSG
ncbi:MAG: XisI protein [Pirellulaceae bacterium]